MTRAARCERTARLLALRLEDVSRTLESGGCARADADCLVARATAATARAVGLRLLTSEQAAAIWADAAARHPALPAPARRA